MALVLFLMITMFVAPCAAGSNTNSLEFVVAQDGTGNFHTISEALAAAPTLSKEPVTIKIKEGTYYENILVQETKPNIVFAGDGMDKTIISGSRSIRQGSTSQSATVAVHGNGFIAMDISFVNTAGPENGPAVAFLNQANHSAAYRCAFSGYQDTLYVKDNLQFYRDCDIYGTIDFIFGDATVVFQNCRIFARTVTPGAANIITAQGRDDPTKASGIVIQNCTLLADPKLPCPSASTFLGRPWRTYSRTVVMESTLGNIINPQGWDEWLGIAGSLDKVYYAEYHNQGPGFNARGRVKAPGCKIIAHETEAQQFTVRNFIQGGNWLPSTGIPFYLDF